ncbi:MAG: hypothetical protein C4321_05975, partial [Chloroflexota bacterium]
LANEMSNLSLTRQARDTDQANLMELDAVLGQTASQINQIPRTIQVVTPAPESPALKKLKEERDNAEGQLKVLQVDRTDNDPSVKQLQERLKTINDLIKAEEAKQPKPTVRNVPNPQYQTAMMRL